MGIGAPQPQKRWHGSIKAEAWRCGETSPCPWGAPPREAGLLGADTPRSSVLLPCIAVRGA
eukprot:8560999-Pyramimonas_sp.AAC.1